MDETAAAGDLALPPAQFPSLPVALVSRAWLVVLLILIVPPLARGMSPEATAALPAWIGRAYSGRCLMTARLIHPDTLLGGQVAAVAGPDVVAMALTLDNRRGVRMITVDASEARLYDFSGRSVAAIPVGLIQGRDLPGVGQVPKWPLSVPPGLAPSTVLLLFPREGILERMNRLYALQFRADGEICNLQGMFSQEPARQGRDEPAR